VPTSDVRCRLNLVRRRTSRTGTMTNRNYCRSSCCYSHTRWTCRSQRACGGRLDSFRPRLLCGARTLGQCIHSWASSIVTLPLAADGPLATAAKHALSNQRAINLLARSGYRRYPLASRQLIAIEALAGECSTEGRGPALCTHPTDEVCLLASTLDHLEQRPSRAALCLCITC
jgi:hypothetical protein